MSLGESKRCIAIAIAIPPLLAIHHKVAIAMANANEGGES